MYIGEYTHSIDDKGRVIMPSKFREELGVKFYVTKGMEGCIFVYDEVEWKRLEEKTKNLKLTSKKARQFERLFYAPARELEFDKQGRFVIPQNLRDYAKIEKEASIIGVSSRIEIWDKNKYEEYISGSEMDYDSITEDFEDLDI
ncbi:division/cell wall cluster transcriptional repressor MraZ [Helcococcus ovis]|uniref:Transcriptional regulator MraZ n=2 Tax=Helcococcus TaxID=31983 RepID=A0A4R9C214_9FIRM|nr:division/cell wall cluster transcriptional repressor MraZ [Helcococcus ovis]TFF64181.1 transcriptional regulator MraZ [Helcococcus ovis]TFF66457.1 transcriptional regulator MraZ [Helcococcus ovis]TFF66933.1 transcriptional regulator MraZ [Helcococcus ovis]WNZ01847.1 division/cell wall cluster transcriptional repressor MraZ [Helcococcus ovis]